ncbi:MAG: ribosome biogenesis GTP-binding protein YihA/YsxC [bacterium]
MSATFLRSIFDPKELPSDGVPEIALIGRSNVGKSSLINALTEKKELAKTSSTPGKTQSLNYFEIDKRYYLVDMPGYGFAKSSKTARGQWAGLIDQYFADRQVLRGVGILLDARHIGLDNDNLIMEWLSGLDYPWFIVLTKVDKVKQQDISAHERHLKKEFERAEVVFKTSSKDGKGIASLRAYLKNQIALPEFATSE